MFIDSHCHLEKKDFTVGGTDEQPERDEREEVLARARENGVEAMVCVGSGASNAEIDTAIEMSDKHDDIWAAIGIHPHDVARHSAVEFAAILERVENLAQNHRKVVAIGESGLDFHYNYSPADAQKEAMRAFIGIGRRQHKPVQLHIRDAHAEAQAIIAEEKLGEVGGVIHCFTGNLADAKRYVDLGMILSFSGIVTFKSATDIKEAAAWAPLDRILIETDCPYLAPIPMRGKRNEPAYIAHTAKVLADLKQISVEELGRATAENARRIFRLT